MTSEWVVERVYLTRPSFVEKAMSDKRLIDVTEIKPDSNGPHAAFHSSGSGMPP